MRVIIADDHRIVRDGLRLILAHDPDISIVAEVEDGASLLEALVTTPADVVLLDVKMPGLSGLDVLEHLQTMPLDVKVVILSMHDDPVYVKAPSSSAPPVTCSRAWVARNCSRPFTRLPPVARTCRVSSPVPSLPRWCRVGADGRWPTSAWRSGGSSSSSLRDAATRPSPPN